MNNSIPHPQAQTIADLSFRLDTCVALAASLAEQATQAFELLAALSPKADAARPVQPVAAQHLRPEDVQRITTLRAKGYGFAALAAETGFNKYQCFAVIVGRYQVLEGGRVRLHVCCDLAVEAEAAVEWERGGGADLWAVPGGVRHG